MTQDISKLRTRYLSVNKQAFQVGDKLDFELFMNKENKKIHFSKITHIISKNDIKEILESEKIFICGDGIDSYKEFIKLKKEALKVKKRCTSGPRTRYLSVNKQAFQVGDKLTFELFINKENKKIHFSKIAHIISEHDEKEILEMEKVFINNDGIDSYKEFVKLKKEALEDKKRRTDIDFIVSEIKNILTEIFTSSNSSKNIQKIYPLASDLSRLIVAKNLQLNDLRKLISKDYETATHSLNVAIYAVVIGREMKFSNSNLKDLILSGMLHDIGKTEISEKILSKVTELNKHDNKEIKKHTTFGLLLAKESGITDKKILSGIHHHHERLDGSGYPNGFKNDHISLFARIIGICDVFDAISTNRGFQDSKKAFDAIVEMKKTMKNQLDSDIVGTFIKVITA